MQIQLRQNEIEAALKMFIAQQGINLTGKTVEIAFTSGRKDNGLSAELTIEDATNHGQGSTYTAHSILGGTAETPTTKDTPEDTNPVGETGEAVPPKAVSLFK